MAEKPEAATRTQDAEETSNISDFIEQFKGTIRESRNLAEETEGFCEELTDKLREVDEVEEGENGIAVIAQVIRGILDDKPDAELRRKFELLCGALQRKDVSLTVESINTLLF